MQNPYETLGVDSGATPEEIKQAYRNKAKEKHPDKHGYFPDDKEFVNLSTAYALLKDPVRRKDFDETGNDVKPPEIERKAGGLLQQLFQLLITKYGLAKIIEVDIVKQIDTSLDKGINEIILKIEKEKEKQGEIKDVLKRLKHKKRKADPIKAMLKHEIDVSKDTIKKYNLEKRVGNKAKTMLKDYTFDFKNEFKVFRSLDYGAFTQTNVTFTGA